MESQPQNPEFRINLENFHPCILGVSLKYVFKIIHKNQCYFMGVSREGGGGQGIQTPMEQP